MGTGCINVGATLDNAAKDKGAYGVIAAAAGILSSNRPACPE